MTDNIPVSDVLAAFDLERGPNFVLADSDAAYSEVKNFEGANWGGLAHTDLIRDFEAPFFFSASAFVYYLPAYILINVEQLKDSALCIDPVLAVLSTSDNPDWKEWRALRTRNLSRPQLMILLRWMEGLAGSSIASSLSNLESAYDHLVKLIA